MDIPLTCFPYPFPGNGFWHRNYSYHNSDITALQHTLKTSNHKLSLHRLTSISSTTNFPWLSHTENWLTRSAVCLQDNSSARTPSKTLSYFVENACLQILCLEIDVLFFRTFAWRGPHGKQFSLNCCHVLKRGFTGRRIKRQLFYCCLYLLQWKCLPVYVTIILIIQHNNRCNYINNSKDTI
jgi:hypothetical protein